MWRARVGVVLALVIAAVLVTGATFPAGAQPDAPGGRFGVLDGAGAANPDALHDLGVAWERVTFPWTAFQPDGPGDWTAEAVDPVILTAAEADGREVVGLILATPRWASPGGSPAAVPDGLALSLDDPGNVWAAFVTRLAVEFAPLGVHRWIIYDQPDVLPGEGRTGFAGSAAEYARLVNVAQQAARAVDPQAAIHLAALGWWADVAAGREPYLARLLRGLAEQGGGDAFDVVTVRVRAGTQAAWDQLAATRAILAAAGLSDKSVWLEAGITPDPGALLGVTPGRAADFAVQVAAIGLVAGAERIAFGPLADLIFPNGERAPAFDACRVAIRLLDGAESATRYTHPLADLVTVQAGERDIYVMWARTAAPVGYEVAAALDEAARVYTPGEGFGVVRASHDWPPAFALRVPGAEPDANGFLTVAGSPRLLLLDRATGVFRAAYLLADGIYVRLR